MLQYTLRVRDLVHGTILFTEREEKIINHRLFQRLRQIRQNDVAFYVYPSLNTSRFEHVLGTCRVAGMMAENLTKSLEWNSYLKELRTKYNIRSSDEFVTLCRLYALLHDIGHPPLSHLFEMAMESWAGLDKIQRAIEEWTMVTGFKKLHEALGATITEQIVQNIGLSDPMLNALTMLMSIKTLPFEDPLSVIKSLIASDIDADRTDFVQRDGRLAGGEYGNYDIKRLCDSVFIERDERGWLLAYSEKAITSMEALLFDRYRTHVWIHFHHRVVATKMLARFLIERALTKGIITKEQFSPTDVESFSLLDDVWLWSLLRNMEPDDEITQIVQRAVFYREKRNIINLWKNRPQYQEMYEKVKKKTRREQITLEFFPMYIRDLNEKLNTTVLGFQVPFDPLSKEAIPLYSEEAKGLTGKSLLKVSILVESLEKIWKGEPQEFILVLGDNIRTREKEIKRVWVDITTGLIRK